MKKDSALFFTCSLIEFIGRVQKRKRSEVVKMLGETVLRRIYKHADVLHSEPIVKTADEFIQMREILTGDFDNVAVCKYEVPDYWTIGEVYTRLIEDVKKDDVIMTLLEIYDSWISDEISRYNSDFYYQPRDYIAQCYKSGKVL